MVNSPNHAEITALAQALGQALLKQNQTLSLAESCTGGLVAAAITEIAGSSAWFDCGFVTYSNQAKISLLKVLSSTLATHGAVSEAIALEMAQGALAQSQASLAASITGIAGPSGGSAQKPVGTVCFGFAGLHFQAFTRTQLFAGNRAQIRTQAVAYALNQLLLIIQKPS